MVNTKINKLVLVFITFDALFVLGGAVIFAVVMMTRSSMNAGPTLNSVATDMLLSQSPLTGTVLPIRPPYSSQHTDTTLGAATVNAIFIFTTFAVSLPAIIFPKNRILLNLHGWLVVICALFTLVVGLDIWYKTLKTRSNLAVAWGQQTAQTQSLLQQRFNCCGYLNSTAPPFQKDTTCTNALVAAQKSGCVTPFSKFANQYLDIVFTADFGIVAIDVILLLCVAMVLKQRKEKERYRLIDEKLGWGPI